MNDLSKWRCKFPNTMDWNFDFYKLLNSNNNTPIGTFRDDEKPKIAIVGAGVAGLLAARELIRAGCKEIDIYEASNRIGGRTYSIKAKGQETCYEMGAMRVPFFKEPRSENCVLDYFREFFNIECIDFPAPGSDKCFTAAYLNDGSGTKREFKKASLITWKRSSEKDADEYIKRLEIYKNSSETTKEIFKEKFLLAEQKKINENFKENPPTRELKIIEEKWLRFSKVFKQFAETKYNSKFWKKYWKKIAQNYHHKDFRQLVFEKNLTDDYWKLSKRRKLSKLGDSEIKELKQLLKNKLDIDEEFSNKSLTSEEEKELRRLEICFKKGMFGGLGFNNDRATTFFTIGAGDGGWGAFYDISSLYVIRTLLSGFGTNHKLIKGCSFGASEQKPYSNLPHKDSLDNHLDNPNFLGIQSFAEGLLYLNIEGRDHSFYDLAVSSDSKINLYTQEPVESIISIKDSKIKIISKNLSREYDDVILTTPTWATQVNLNLKFPETKLPNQTVQSMKFSHWINSCKLFFPLKERFWDKKNQIFPQVILTDTFIQDVYIYAANDSDPGVLLASYTWEDNSMKMLGFETEQKMADACLRKLDAIFTECDVKILNEEGKEEPLIISNFVNRENPIIIHWSKKPTYAGCSKLYRQNNERENYHLLNYNRHYSKESHLLFAGEAYSVEGGWIEPAVRLALDAVIHLIDNHGGNFKKGFNYDIYEELTNTEYLRNLTK